MVSRVSVMVLGLLAEGERHGYDLVREMEERGMLRWTHASKVAVYGALARLEEEGCLTSWTERRGGAPEKRVYSITEQGTEKLRDLVYALCSSREPLPLDTNVGLVFAHHLAAAEAEEALARRLEFVEEEERRLRREARLTRGLAGGIMPEILRHELAVYREEARWLKRVMAVIAGGGEKRR